MFCYLVKRSDTMRSKVYQNTIDVVFISWKNSQDFFLCVTFFLNLILDGQHIILFVRAQKIFEFYMQVAYSAHSVPWFAVPKEVSRGRQTLHRNKYMVLSSGTVVLYICYFAVAVFVSLSSRKQNVKWSDYLLCTQDLQSDINIVWLGLVFKRTYDWW